jgi:hypothetical protein
MNGEQATAHVLSKLAEFGIDHMLVGAFSSNAYGVARATKDADIVVEFKTIKIVEFCNNLGDGFVLDRQMMLEGFTGSSRNVIEHSESGFDIELFRLNDDEHQQERFARKKRHLIGELNIETWIPTAEDVVVQKLRWARRKDLDDVVNVLNVSGESLDWQYLKRWTDEHGTSELLKQMRRECTD